jgi:hypothetical protein
LLLHFSFVFFLFFSPTASYFVFNNYLYVHMIWISTKPYKTYMKVMNAYVNKHAYKHTYICICVFLRLSLHLGVYCSLEIRCFTRFVAYPITKTMFHS